MDPTIERDGLVLAPGVTNKKIHPMVQIVFIFESDYERNDDPLLQGKYYITGMSARFFVQIK